MTDQASCRTTNRLRRALGGLPAGALFLVTGCLTLPAWHPFETPKPPPGPADAMVLRGDQLEKDSGVVAKKGKTADDLDGARELFRRGEYAQAEKVYHRIAEDTKNSPQIAEEARYYEAESLRLQGRYPKAADTYSKLLKDFVTTSQYRDQATRRLFDIANYWLDDTRKEMEEAHKKGGSGWFIMPVTYVHWDKTKPLMDEEGWAVEKLEEVKLDIRGPMADKAMFYLGSVKFFRRDYREAEQHFSQLVEMLPESPLAPQALKMAIVCKQLSTGGSDYDGRRTAEARQLIDTALANYPQLAEKEKPFLMRQIRSINMQQADKDFKIAEFYRRTGHPGSAYFYYEIVRRRYPGTSYFDKATQRMHELRAALEKEKAGEKKGLAIPLPFRPKKTDPAAPGAPVAPGAPLVYPERGPAPRPLPPEMAGGR